jgi:hypothetical protein
VALPRHAQSRHPIPWAHVTGSIELDRHSEQPAWHGVEPFLLSMYGLTSGSSLSERATMLAAIDDPQINVARA